MRCGLCVLALAACGKDASIKMASPAEATAVATKLATAMTACDEPALTALLDFGYLASRAGGDDAFVAEARKQHLSCKSMSDRMVGTVVARPGAAKPLIRWRKGTGCPAAFGYVELTVEAGKTPRIADIEAPLHPQSAVVSLRNIQNLPRGDQPGMISDIAYGPFSTVISLETAGALIPKLDMPAHPIGVEKHPEDLDLAIAYGFMEHDYSAVQVAANAAGKLVGEDAALASIRVAAAIGAKNNEYALQLAREATAKWPDDVDAWCARWEAEGVAGDTKGRSEAKIMLDQKFQILVN